MCSVLGWPCIRRSNYINASAFFAQKDLGGGEGVKGIYGSLTVGGMTTIANHLVAYTGLGSESVLVDFGAGLGRPAWHFLVHPGVKKVVLLEDDFVKMGKAKAFMTRVGKKMGRWADGTLPKDPTKAWSPATVGAWEQLHVARAVRKVMEEEGEEGEDHTTRNGQGLNIRPVTP